MLRSVIQICKIKRCLGPFSNFGKNPWDTPEISLFSHCPSDFKGDISLNFDLMEEFKFPFSMQFSLWLFEIWIAVMLKLAFQRKTQQWIHVFKDLLDFQNKIKYNDRDVVLRQKAKCYCFLLLRISHWPISGETALYTETADIWNSF